MSNLLQSKTALLGRQIERAQFHIGMGYTSRTGQDSKVDKAYMEVTPGGVYIENKEGEWLVPYSNVVWCKLAPLENKTKVA